MNRTTRLAGTVGAFVVAGVGATVFTDQRSKARRRRRGEDVAFGSVHGDRVEVTAHDGVRLNVEVDEPDQADDATPTVLFVHGWVCTLDTWHYQRLALRGQVRMVFLDQRSHGRSGRTGARDSTFADLAADLRSVLDRVAPSGPVVLVGHSMGGMAVMQLAIDEPEFFAERVRGVLLVATSAGRLMRGSPALRRLVPLLRVASPVLDWGRAFNSYSVIKRWGLGPRAQERHVDMTNEMLLRAPLHVLLDFYPNFVDLDLRAALPIIARTHAAVVAGTDDQMTPLSHNRRLAEALDCRFVVVEDAGHMVMFEAHQKVTEAVEKIVHEVREETA